MATHYNTKEGKKVALRFLKEAGLYTAWKEYISSDEKRKKYCSNTPRQITTKDWYKKTNIDSIFGDTLFTNFLLNKYNLNFPSTISSLFRFYLRTIYGNKFSLKLPFYYDAINKTICTIDKETNNIHIRK